MANVLLKVPVFFGEVRAELAKVAWPTRKELIGTAWIVITITAILTAYVGILDFVLSKAVLLVLK